MRRHSAIGTLMGMIARDIKNAAIGKIPVVGPWHWAAGSEPAVNPQGVIFKAREDLNGNMMTLKKGFGVYCPNPPEISADAPLLNGGFSVRRAHCMRCPHHLPNMCCAILREGGKAKARSLAEDVIKARNAAAKFIEKKAP